MATLVLGAVGASLGAGFGGSVLGLSGAVIGRAVGATVGRVIDQAVLGQGAEAVEHGRLERLRLTGASEGAPIPRVYGRVRLAGQVIWATRFRENRTTTGGGGKGAPKAPKQTSFSYSVSLALALCEGRIRRVSRVWADGVELDWDSLQLRVHDGSEDQLPDALIEAVEGRAAAPAYRGTAYVVIEELDITPFGNRVPQFTFEVVRHAPSNGETPSAAELIRGVALVPGSGEYSLATSRVHYDYGDRKDSANVNTVQSRPDFRVAMRDLVEELPNLRSVSLIVSWFGDDLRAGRCRIRPKVEQNVHEGEPQAWRVSGLSRAAARAVPRLEGRPVYGGTPSDASVIEAIRDLNARGLDVTFYPFILMEQLTGNGLPDPWGADEQAPLPWRGRITTERAPGRPDTTDRTAAAAAEVAAFFGAAQPGAFVAEAGGLGVSGPAGDWSYRRFILHCARLCALAGGVEAFCIGTEMRGLTSIRGAGDTFPAVAAMRALARDVRAILPGAKIGYAADWSEYFGYRPEDSGDVHFHLDPLWGDPAIDYVGIDNYMPLADWRDGPEHLDARHRSGRDLAYLRANVEGGEGFDWFYASDADRFDQRRTPITDGAHGEPWVYRYKDLQAWWSNLHHDRIGGVRGPQPTAWAPRSKPIRFVEYGCAAIDKGANQPNKFIDPKSSESSLPYFSNGFRDDTMQQQYLRALLTHWAQPSSNPLAPSGGPMLDLDHSFAWAWDARPWPYFPQMAEHWTDGANHARGHWLTGRSANQPLETVVRELCQSAGVEEIDTTGLHGVVRGYAIARVQSARADLQPLLMAHGVEASERDGRLVFSMRSDARAARVDPARMVRRGEGVLELQRAPLAETPGAAVVHHFDHDGDYAATLSEASMPGTSRLPVSETELPLSLTRGDARALAERFLAEGRVVRDTLEFHLPPSRADLRAGDQFVLAGESDLWRIDRLDDAGTRHVRAVRTERGLYEPGDDAEVAASRTRPVAPLPVEATFLDLPLLRGDESPYAPYLALTGRPWPGSVAVHSSIDDSDYRLNTVVEAPAVVGSTETALGPARPALWDRGPALIVRFGASGPASVSEAALLAGANAAAIRGGGAGRWEVFQFRDAAPVGEGVWALSMRLRGQRGTEWGAASGWPVGSQVVLLADAVEQIDAGRDILNLPRHYRIGPARLPLSDASYRHIVHATTGEALRPFAPAHVRVDARSGGLRVRWMRRSRVEQAEWGVADVPLGEAREVYLVRALDARGGVRLERSVDVPEAWLAGADVAGAAAIAVAQVSDEIGPGAWATVAIG